jgi:hypothetical protein
MDRERHKESPRLEPRKAHLPIGKRQDEGTKRQGIMNKELRLFLGDPQQVADCMASMYYTGKNGVEILFLLWAVIGASPRCQ